MKQLSPGTAYLLWGLCFFGICGGQRFYTGHIGSGLLYLFTWGLFGIGQLIDLALIPDMVNNRNIYLRGLHGSSQLPEFQTVQLPIGYLSPMQKLLKAAKEHGGQLSIAQAAMHTDLAPKQVKELLLEAMKAGYAEINNDPITGAIRYHFDV